MILVSQINMGGSEIYEFGVQDMMFYVKRNNLFFLKNGV